MMAAADPTDEWADAPATIDFRRSTARRLSPMPDGHQRAQVGDRTATDECAVRALREAQQVAQPPDSRALSGNHRARSKLTPAVDGGRGHRRVNKHRCRR
jgi:hypothetical protein